MTNVVRLLHLEDNPADCELIPATLEAGGFQVKARQVGTREDFVQALAEGDFDLILADCKLPGFDGLEALALAQEKRPATPFIFVSGFIGEEVALESLKHGATDYVFKHNLARLGPAVRRALREAHESAEKKLLEEQFLRAQRLESIGTLASGIAHDLNNVLAPIVMSLRLFRQKLTSREDQEVLASMEASARRGADIIRQLLTFARGAEGTRQLLSIGDLVRDLEKVLRDTVPRSIQIETKLPPDLRPVMSADPTQLYQVLMNLCVNARDAMAGGGSLSLRAENIALDADSARRHPGARPGPYVMVQVGDSGSGIAPEVLDRIFDPFFTTKETGTGLGLSTALAIVKSHGGFFTVTSLSGQGSTFRVHLPAGDASAAAPDVPPPLEPPRGHGETILVVDDELPIRQISRTTLEIHGYRVLTAAHGSEALALFARERARIRLVVTDIMMPRMDGARLVQALRQQQPDLKIIAMSGLVDGEALAAKAEFAGTVFLQKPFLAEHLLQAVHDALRRFAS